VKIEGGNYDQDANAVQEREREEKKGEESSGGHSSLCLTSAINLSSCKRGRASDVRD